MYVLIEQKITCIDQKIFKWCGKEFTLLLKTALVTTHCMLNYDAKRHQCEVTDIFVHTNYDLISLRKKFEFDSNFIEFHRFISI